MAPITVRPALPADLAALAGVERDADAVFEALFGVTGWEPEDGAVRAAMPGFLLVAAAGGSPVGFVHVLEVDSHAHLEQLSVTPAHARRGIGRALVEAALATAAARGHARITLRTFRDVAWNGPFYEACGFVVSPTTDSAFHRGLVATERALGLTDLAPRVEMSRVL